VAGGTVVPGAPELPSRRRTATKIITLGQYQWSQAAEAGVLTKMFQGTNHSRSSAYGDYTNSTTHSQCRLHQSDQNYQAMPTIEPLDIVDVPTDLSTPFDYLTNSDTNAGQR
jgi:hypothetical protein